MSVSVLCRGFLRVRLLYSAGQPRVDVWRPALLFSALMARRRSLESMLVVALKRAGFAGSRSRTALWEIPTQEIHIMPLLENDRLKHR
jgi:hypothetical protein